MSTIICHSHPNPVTNISPTSTNETVAAPTSTSTSVGKQTQPPASSLSAHPTSTRLKAPKYRTSCDACQIVKIRCGQQKPSCQRCTDQGSQCVYSLSRRMGRPRQRPNTNATVPAAPAPAPALAQPVIADTAVTSTSTAAARDKPESSAGSETKNSTPNSHNLVDHHDLSPIESGDNRDTLMTDLNLSSHFDMNFSGPRGMIDTSRLSMDWYNLDDHITASGLLSPFHLGDDGMSSMNDIEFLGDSSTPSPSLQRELLAFLETPASRMSASTDSISKQANRSKNNNFDKTFRPGSLDSDSALAVSSRSNYDLPSFIAAEASMLSPTSTPQIDSHVCPIEVDSIQVGKIVGMEDNRSNTWVSGSPTTTKSTRSTRWMSLSGDATDPGSNTRGQGGLCGCLDSLTEMMKMINDQSSNRMKQSIDHVLLVEEDIRMIVKKLLACSFCLDQRHTTLLHYSLVMENIVQMLEVSFKRKCTAHREPASNSTWAKTQSPGQFHQLSKEAPGEECALLVGSYQVDEEDSKRFIKTLVQARLGKFSNVLDQMHRAQLQNRQAGVMKAALLITAELSRRLHMVMGRVELW